MRYIIYAPLQIICMILCYLTNWLVILFADEDGELPGPLRLWQTWDDPLDNATDVERMPPFLRYDWDEHYAQCWAEEQGQTRYLEVVIKPFTLTERIKRYFCRVHWLYRNCGYGFAYYLFGATVTPPFHVCGSDEFYFIPGRVWALKCTTAINDSWRWDIYLGWKIQRRLDHQHRAMIATRLWIKRR